MSRSNEKEQNESMNEWKGLMRTHVRRSSRLSSELACLLKLMGALPLWVTALCTCLAIFVLTYVISIYLPGRMTLLCNILLCNSFCLKVYFVRYKISHFCSLLFIIYMEYLFLSLAFQLMCVLKSKSSVL